MPLRESRCAKSRHLDCERVRTNVRSGQSCGVRLNGASRNLAALLSNICIVCCAVVEYEKQQQGGPEIIWPH
jgi:hypothetical protein